MKTTSLWICGAVLAAVSTFAAAADQPGATTREQRMDEALADYHAGQPSASPENAQKDCVQSSDGGTFARAEASIKRGACKTGHAIERGVKKTGHAIDKAARKTGDAVRNTGEKLGGSPDKATTDPTPR